jgi:excisionase family DNA binding protein
MVEKTTDRLCLTVDEAREILGISRGLMYEAVRTGQVPSIRVGKRILIPQHAFYRFLGVITDRESNDSEPP